MAVLKVRDEDVVELACQLPDELRRALALALLRDGVSAPSLRTIRERSQTGLTGALRTSGLDMGSSSSEQIDAAIQRICEEP